MTRSISPLPTPSITEQIAAHAHAGFPGGLVYVYGLDPWSPGVAELLNLWTVASELWCLGCLGPADECVCEDQTDPGETIDGQALAPVSKALPEMINAAREARGAAPLSTLGQLQPMEPALVDAAGVVLDDLRASYSPEEETDVDLLLGVWERLSPEDIDAGATAQAYLDWWMASAQAEVIGGRDARLRLAAQASVELLLASANVDRRLRSVLARHGRDAQDFDLAQAKLYVEDAEADYGYRLGSAELAYALNCYVRKGRAELPVAL